MSRHRLSSFQTRGMLVPVLTDNHQPGLPPARILYTNTPPCKKMMNGDTTKSPPTSPPAKRAKTETTVPVVTTSNSTDSGTTTTTVPTAMAANGSPPLLVKKLSDTARLPTHGSAFAAGYDLYASKDTTVPARGKCLVSTDISIAVPADTYGRIAPRSGLASKHFIDTGAGVIDADYRGEVKVLLFNHGADDFAVTAGDRIAQLVLERICRPDVVEVQTLEESVRGAGGFGSTGTN